MTPVITIAGAQMGATQKNDTRESVAQRIQHLIEQAAKRGAQLIVFPELCLTPFFPRWYYETLEEADQWFEDQWPPRGLENALQKAKDLNIMVQISYAEKTLDNHRYNTARLISSAGEHLMKYRKIHLPGHADYIPERPLQHLEKRYFEVGNLGFPVERFYLENVGEFNLGMLLCNDRRWPEAWRVLGLQEVDIVLIGYNTPVANLDVTHHQPPHLKVMQSNLSVQAGCYQNNCFGVSVAKAGVEDGHAMFGSSIIVNPFGEIIARSSTWHDELIIADCDLSLCQVNRASTFNFEAHRRPEHYQRIVEQTGSIRPKKVVQA
ncbi:N-carbamoyl-D-amino-acid hydrolase [Paenalcaligenes hominis]|uniref:N-carbamoyl-D-amino-acid hydrolase n=1 Tax=Paenalcaligenes hominis TaxID=643674 RepID=A0A1U9JYN1_9BURK|nr:nitrilase-related carbon-nitrogen hydrolase [Paenalcaligenes hominis]AQS50854.1 N-carbamoyl-D-amino-acid hydrolase [Paenalcaligenes hominis]